ncbi:MAG: nucleoside hydrolase [Pseudomonadales bacterium]
MPIPVILDTDIGFDVDDVWALALMLKSPELDVKLIVTDTGDTHYSARLVAKLLQVAGREDIPVGIGIPLDFSPRTHELWLGDFSLDDFRGQVFSDGVGAICDTIMQSSEQVAIICIGPVPNIAAALLREPRITENSRFIGMHGSIRRGYLGASKPMKEYNVKKHTASCQSVFSTPWDISITPLDTCGTVILKDENFARLKDSDDALTKAVLENHFIWCEAVKDWPVLADMDPATQSSLLYDTVAIYMAFSEDFLEMESLPIVVTDDGKTMIDETGQMVRCAMNWKDQQAFEEFISERLC